MSNFKGFPVEENIDPFDVTGEMGLDESLLDLPALDLEDVALDGEGLGAVRHRRLSAKTRRKLSRLAKKRSRTKKGRFAGLGGSKRRGRKGRRGHRKAPRGAVARGKRLAKKMKRSKRTGRFVGLRGLELLGLSDVDGDAIDDMNLLSQTEGLGAARRRRRVKAATRRKLRKAAKRRHRRKSGRFAGLGRLASISDGIGQVEVASSMPVVGAFQWLATGPGLEALGGVVLAPVVMSLVKTLVNYIPGAAGATGAMGTLVKVGGGLISSILMWEFGKVVGSANIAKFGAFYSIGRIVEGIVMPLLSGAAPGIFPPLSGFGEVRIPDTQSSLGLVLPDQAELVGLGTRRVSDTSELGQVLLPGVRRPDYAVNPLSGVRTTDTTDVDAVGDIDDIEGEEEMAGAEESELF